jgi:hypothetical protein
VSEAFRAEVHKAFHRSVHAPSIRIARADFFYCIYVLNVPDILRCIQPWCPDRKQQAATVSNTQGLLFGAKPVKLCGQAPFSGFGTIMAMPDGPISAPAGPDPLDDEV